MATSDIKRFTAKRNARSNFILPIMIMWGLVGLAVLSFVWLENDFSSSLQDLYLLPWAILTGICVISPSIYLFYKGKFDLFHPLVFAAWSYILPAFVFGGVIIAFGWVNPYFLVFIEDPQYNLPLTMVYIGIGFLGLSAGFFLPIGKFFANKIENILPTWNWKPETVWTPGVLLLLIGVGFNILGFIQGLLGFQRNIEINVFDGLLFFLLIVLTEGTVLLWLAIFTTKQKNGIYYIMLIVLILFLPLRMAVLGSRSSLITGLLPIAMAFLYSGRRLKWQTTVVFGFIAVFAVLIGVIYGTTFRNIKGSEARINTGDYIGQIGETLDYLTTADPVIVAEQSAQALADRIENLSSVAVVVANYEKLAPYEASYGLENNIFNDLYTSFIPRFVWKDKPPTSDARAYSDLYFNYGDNSFAISPFADLLRNFGPIGVPLGMLLLGIYLRFIYAALIDTPNPALWKKVAYFPLLTVVSYEAFYATIFPSVIRTIFVLAISLFLVNIIAKKSKGHN
ncbi:hypothetical protein BH10ACI1_BH10ACI1_23820 [soil metagenome]